jgi:excisionase family DNA binding protein
VTTAGADRARAEPISVKIPEAVRLTGLSRSRIYELMKSGAIEYAKVGSSTLILVESLRRFIDSCRSRFE